MKRLELNQMEMIEGEGACENFSSAALGLGLRLVIFSGGFPLVTATGIVVAAVGAVGAVSCSWN